MRIALDISTVRGRITGVGLVAYHLWRTLCQHPDVELIPIAPEFMPDTWPHTDAINGHRTRSFSTRLGWLQFDVPAWIHRHPVDLVHFTNFLAPLGFRHPYVVHIHDLSVFRHAQTHPIHRRWVFSTWIPATVRRAHRVITVSRWMAREIASYFDLDPGRVVTVYNGIDPLFRRLPTRAYRATLERYRLDAPYFLIVSELNPRKNIDTVLRAFAKAHRTVPHLLLVLVGPRGLHARHTLDLIRTLHLEDRVRVLGYVPRRDLVHIYNGATAVLYPSRYEGFGLPILEALATGTPVLASRIPVHEEIGGSGPVLIDPHDIDAWADTLSRVAEDPKTFRERIKRATPHLARFTWDRSVRQLVEIYREVCTEIGTKRPTRLHTVERPGVYPASVYSSIHRALVYFALFKYPVTIEELHRAVPDVTISQNELSTILHMSPPAGVAHLDGFYGRCTSRAELARWIRRRDRRERQYHALYQRHARIIRWICRLPYVRMVALSGGAMFTTDVRDIDLFVITRPHRAALVFWAIRLLARCTRTHRTICVNYLVDETAMALPERDFYTGHQIIHLRPLCGYPTYLRFWYANPWVHAQFPNAHPIPPETSDRRAPFRRLLEWLGTACGATLWNRWGCLLLRMRLRSRLTPHSGVRITPHILKLHVHDYRPVLLARLHQAVEKTAMQEKMISEK